MTNHVTHRRGKLVQCRHAYKPNEGPSSLGAPSGGEAVCSFRYSLEALGPGRSLNGTRSRALSLRVRNRSCVMTERPLVPVNASIVCHELPAIRASIESHDWLAIQLVVNSPVGLELSSTRSTVAEAESDATPPTHPLTACPSSTSTHPTPPVRLLANGMPVCGFSSPNVSDKYLQGSRVSFFSSFSPCLASLVD
jgi:hypothetical protein